MSPWIGPGRTIATCDDEVVEFSRLEARQHVHLRPALDLEDADRIALLQHVVDRLIVLRDGVRARSALPPCRGDQVERLADAGQHAERQHIDLHHAEVSMSSLSHSMKVRSFMAALPIGTSSSSRPRVSTKPPTCWERWRGKPRSSVGEARPPARSAGLFGSRPASRDLRSVDARRPSSPQTVPPSARSHPRSGPAPCRPRGWRCAGDRR